MTLIRRPNSAKVTRSRKLLETSHLTRRMSEELEWELYDIFASGIFAFPIYEHNSARRIVRYLLMRGVPAEDVAAAIEDHEVDLRAWLERRPGHHMVGEWVMAWLNDSRDQYKADRREERLDRRRRRRRIQRSVSPMSGAPTAGVSQEDDLTSEPYYGGPFRGPSPDTVSNTTASGSCTSSTGSSSSITGSTDTFRNCKIFATRARRNATFSAGSVNSSDDDADSISGAVVGDEDSESDDDDDDEVNDEEVKVYRSAPELHQLHVESTRWVQPAGRSCSAQQIGVRQHSSVRHVVAPLLALEPEALASAALQRRQAGCAELQQRRSAAVSEADTGSTSDPPDSGNVSDMQCACAAIACCASSVGHDCCSVFLTAGRSCSPAPATTLRLPQLTDCDGDVLLPLPSASCDGCRCTLSHYVASDRQHYRTWPVWTAPSVPPSSPDNEAGGAAGGNASAGRGGGRTETADGVDAWPVVTLIQTAVDAMEFSHVGRQVRDVWADIPTTWNTNIQSHTV